MSAPATANIIWLPGGDSPAERRSVFDYESGSFGGGSSRSIAGIKIDSETALRSTVVLACVRVLGESIASLPLHVYRRLPGGGKEIAREHPLYRLLHGSPNDWQTSFEWREQQLLHLGTYGQSFSEIVRSGSDIVTALLPLHPSRMKVERVESGALRYRYTEEDGTPTDYTQGDVMHLRWLSNDSINGMVPVELARDAIALARACEVHGAAYFGNGARPGVILSTDGTLSQEAAEALRINWERVHRGPDRSSKTAVLTGGLKPVEIGTNNQESQFLETRRFQIEEICRLFRVPPHLVGDLTRSSFSNVEQQSLDFVQHTLVPWMRRFESAFARDLLGGDDEFFVEFDTRGLLRGDAAGRASYYQTLSTLGVASINEIRAWENLNPVDGGDSRFVQLNMQTLANAAKEPEKPQTPEPPAASVGDLVAVLQQVAAGTVGPSAAKEIMAAVFPALDGKSADAIIGGVAPPKAEEKPRPEPVSPAADVGGLAAVIGQVRDGVIGPEAAIATLASVYPSLPQETARLIVSGVKSPPPPTPMPPQPSADVSGLLAILGQVSQGAVTPASALSIIDAVYPGMSEALASGIVSGAKQPPPAPPAAAPASDKPAEPPAGGSPRESRSVISIDFDRTFAANPVLWGAFARQSVAAGNTVVMVSRRPDTPENQEHIGSTLGEYRESFSHVLLVGDRLKDEAAREAGVEVDIWVDDSPQFVRAAESRASADAFAEGDFVSWGSAGGRARGRVEHVMDYGTLDVPGTDFKIDASEDDPAALITVYEKVTGGWLPTSTKVGHKVATLTKIGPLEEPKDERAFCPGASPPDNSCSPSNKGTASPSPAVPAPDGRVASEDARGAITGHSEGQRLAYAKDLAAWLKQEHGVDLWNYGDWTDPAPPSMPAMLAVASGVTRLSAMGIAPPASVQFDEELPPSAAGSYQFWNNVVTVNPSLDSTKFESSRPGQFASKAAEDLIVHEVSHRDHLAAIRENLPSSFKGVDGEAFEIAVGQRLGELLGVPDEDGFPTKDPWTKAARFGSRTKGDGGRQVDPDAAREIASKVSEYATLNPLEFVAEVRTGALAGVAYGDDVLSLYEDYSGPPLVSRKAGAKTR